MALEEPEMPLRVAWEGWRSMEDPRRQVWAEA